MRHVDTNRTRLVRKARPTSSFFNFFNPPEPPSKEAPGNGDNNEEALEEWEERCEVDYQLGKDIKERVSFRCLFLPISRGRSRFRIYTGVLHYGLQRRSFCKPYPPFPAMSSSTEFRLLSPTEPQNVVARPVDSAVTGKLLITLEKRRRSSGAGDDSIPRDLCDMRRRFRART